MEIIILGPNCANCIELEKRTKKMVDLLGITAHIKKEEDMMKIMEYGVMRTPALVIDGKVVMSGRLPNDKELRKLLESI